MKQLYPKRGDTHKMQSVSWRLLENAAPQEWIVREATEVDYGIDAYIEIARSNGDVTGDLFLAQIKSEEKIDWHKKDALLGRTTTYSIKTTTARYWLGLQVPVFLFDADLSSDRIYFSSVKEQIRRDFAKLDAQDSMSFLLSENECLNASNGGWLFQQQYERETAYADIAFHLSHLISQVQPSVMLLGEHQGRDCFGTVDDLDQLQFRALYEACRWAAFYFNKDLKLPPIIDIYRADRAKWRDDDSLLHEETIEKTGAALSKIFPNLVRSAIELVRKTERDFWREKDAVLFALCGSPDLKSALETFEEQFGL